MTSTLRLDNVNFDVPLPNGAVGHIVRQASLTVSRGECLAIMGPSGSGKTSILAIAGLLEPPTSGRVILDDVDVTSTSDAERTEIRNRRFGFVFQNFSLQPHVSVRRNVEIPLVYRGAHASERSTAADTWLDKVGLGDRGRSMPRHLSGGEQQRVAIARALVGSPDMIFADEPTAALDFTTGRDIINLLIEQVRTAQCGMIIVTHDHSVAALMDRTIRISDGVLDAP